MARGGRHVTPQDSRRLQCVAAILLVLSCGAQLPASSGARMQPPQPGADADCIGARGRWCGSYLAQTPEPVRPPRPRTAACPRNCSGIGTCIAHTAACHCPAGEAPLRARRVHGAAPMQVRHMALACLHVPAMR